MAILSDKNYVGGKPRIEGHRLWVSHIIANVADQGLEEYIDDFELHGEEQKIREAIEYCMNEDCIGHAVTYCQDCNKCKEFPGEDLWKVAKELYEKYFLE